MIQRVESFGVDVCVLGALAALDPGLGDGLDAVVCSSDGSCHAGDGVCVPSEGQAVRYRPFQASVALWKALLGLKAVEDAEDGRRDRVESCNAVACREEQAPCVCALWLQHSQLNTSTLLVLLLLLD